MKGAVALTSVAAIVLVVLFARACAKESSKGVKPAREQPLALVHFLGRFDTRGQEGPRFSWPGSGIAASFDGTGVDVMLEDTGADFFSIVVDGGATTTLATSRGTGTYPLASGLPGGRHSIVLTKRTESFVGVARYLGLAPYGGALVPSPDPFSRRIEYVGDSITCGYGNLGADASCGFSPQTEDEIRAYGALTAADLHAEQTVVAYSGVGLMRNHDGSTKNLMPVRFERTLADDPTSRWAFEGPPPDVVVIGLGTNDFAMGDPGPGFAQAYTAFILQLRAHYAAAEIVCTLGPMLRDSVPPGTMSRTQAGAYIEAAVKEARAAGDAHVRYLAFDEQQARDGYGCDWHPSLATHRLMAVKLEALVREITGW
ncbi:MAG: SGNH/GDSL hydrolase family protein [Polyangiaceae bacterium]|jgi:lysophospholipase L1-like esterase